jgi:hypothetical protein
MAWSVLRAVILTPLVLAIAILILLAIGVHFALENLQRRQTCAANP